MKTKMIKYLLVFLALSCSQNGKEEKKEESELEKLKAQVASLLGTIEQIDSFTANDFASCKATLPPFEKKICKIAQTATAEQLVQFVGQLQEFSKMTQTTIYGDDCTDVVESGCPAAGSIMERLEEIESSLNDAEADIIALQADILSLNAALASLNSRLDDFNGSGSSIETVISGIESDLDDLEDRVSDVEDTLDEGNVYKIVSICGNIFSSGPLYEAFLVTGDDTKAVALVQSGSKRGLGVVAEAGVSGTLFKTTSLNTNSCNFKIYDLTTTLKICWKNTDRSASSAAINTACDSANNFASPLVSCTCAN